MLSVKAYSGLPGIVAIENEFGLKDLFPEENIFIIIW